METGGFPGAGIAVRKLRTEYLENPLGIDALRPRLEWQITSRARSAVQTAYQVQAAADPTQLKDEAGLLWDSGKVLSDQTLSIPYDGPLLSSRERVYWRVRAWDRDDRPSNWSAPAWWEMGLLAESDWTADWIEAGWDEDPEAFKPSPYFRRDFTLPAPVKFARLYISSHGLYEAWLNGRMVGDQVFTPGYTPYDKLLQYQVYDVGKLLHNGANAIGAILGDGWYRGRVYVSGSRNVYGTRLALMALLVVETVDGQVTTIGTGPEWSASTGPILKSDMKDGEVYDARLELSGWSAPGYAVAWQPVRVVQHPKAVLVASMGVPVRRRETFKPRLIVTPKGETVLDFGQNLAGVVRFKVRGPRGTTIRLRHGETLDKNGNFTVDHLFNAGVPDLERQPFQEVRYTLSGAGADGGFEEYEPHFTVHGFRYVKVEGYPGEINPDDFLSVAIYSDMPRTGAFECSDPLINRLHENAVWSMKSNFLDLPTDCPQRERAGWTGDAQIFTPPASFLMDTRAFLRKWLRELRIEQHSDGMMGNFVPNPYRLVKNFLTRLDGSAGWGDVAVLMPWALYEAYGDMGVLEDQYESMKAWVGYVQRRAATRNWSRNLAPRLLADPARRARWRLIWDTNYQWGEWLEPGEGEKVPMYSGVIRRLLFGEPVVATAYFAHSTAIVSQTARLLGKQADAERFGRLAEEVKAAYQAEFIRPDGRIDPDRQASYVRVLAFDLAPEELKGTIVEHLVRLVRASGDHVGTGFLSTVFLCQVLADNGRLDVAYDLLTQKTIPSWLYPVTKGATTIWENWEGIKPDGTPTMGSLNHYSPGAVVDFLHRVVAGISPAEPGYRRIVIHPRPGGGLTSASATYESVHGLVACGWEKRDGILRVKATIPANTRAMITLPGAKVDEVTECGVPLAQAAGLTEWAAADGDAVIEAGSGSYEFEYRLR